jgi:hypothetical protein
MKAQNDNNETAEKLLGARIEDLCTSVTSLEEGLRGIYI